jgi:hypothetical protein
MRFGKDGTVKPDFHRLSDDKDKQELGVGERLAPFVKEICGADVVVKSPDDSSHDFRILADGKEIVVECTEIVPHNILMPTGSDSSLHILVDGSTGETRPINIEQQESIVAQRVNEKLSKNYSKPADSEYWLIIFSTGVMPLGNYVKGGQRMVSKPIAAARKVVAERGAGPFDRIMYFDLVTRPSMIWPAIG